MFISSSILSWNHIHPVLVHFSTALIPTSLASDALGKYFKRESLTAAGWWMMLYGAFATPFTVLAGWLWGAQFSASASMSLPGLAIHKWLGTSLAIAFAMLALWRGRDFIAKRTPRIAYLITAALVVSALMYQGFLGGQMTIG